MPDPELESMLQQLIDAGGTDEELDELTNSYLDEQSQRQATAERNKFVGDVYKGPDTFWGGVMKSLNPFADDGGEAIEAAKQGAKGYAKGAVLDIPQSIVGGITGLASGAYGMATDPVGTISSVPGKVRDIGRGIAQTTMQAGSEPEAFGRMSGQITGQPLVTAGLAPHTPAMIRGAGVPTEFVGQVMSKYQPVSGIIPKIGEPRTLRNIEKFVGGKVESAGKKMQSYGRAATQPSSRNIPPNPTSNTPPNNPPNPTASTSSFEQQVMRPANAPKTGDPEIDAILESFKQADQPVNVVESAPGEIVNASGESSASAEALSRNVGMRERGEKYVVYDRAGNKRDLIGPDAVDFTPSRGETYGIETNHGFIQLEDNGGKVTATRTIKPKRREYPGYKGKENK